MLVHCSLALLAVEAARYSDALFQFDPLFYLS